MKASASSSDLPLNVGGLTATKDSAMATDGGGTMIDDKLGGGVDADSDDVESVSDDVGFSDDDVGPFFRAGRGIV